MFLGTVWSESGFAWFDFVRGFWCIGLRYDGFLVGMSLASNGLMVFPP